MNNQKIKAIIVDDEAHCRDSLEQQISWCCPQLDVVYKAIHVDDALQAIAQYQPDILFLDIEMPGKNGFELLKSLDEIRFEVIFTTAYDEFALEAFRVQAIDYLLKPIEEEHLIKAVEKAVFLTRIDDTLSQLEDIMSKIGQKRSDRTIVLPTAESAEFVQSEEIMHCKADGSYTRIHLSDDRQFILAKSLQAVEKLIALPHFIRTHQSHLVNAQYIRRFVHSDGGMIVLKDGSEIPVARSRRKAWKAWVDSL